VKAASSQNERKRLPLYTMLENAIILVGMMGAGKSTVGKSLASQLGVSFADTDTLLVNKLGRPISQIFELYGEKTFRDHETSLLQSLKLKPQVLATGGGIVLREENWAEMRRLGTTIFLEVPVENLIQRLKRSRKPRPLLAVPNPEAKIREIYSAREELYKKADITINLGGKPLSEWVTAIRKELGL
jgi:shikimate kinase